MVKWARSNLEKGEARSKSPAGLLPSTAKAKLYMIKKLKVKTERRKKMKVVIWKSPKALRGILKRLFKMEE